MELRYSEDDGTVFFPEDCVIENAVEIKTALLEALGRAATVSADVSKIRRLDLSGIQLMYAFLRSGNTGERRLYWTGRFQDAAENAFRTSGYAEAMAAYRIEPGEAHER